MKLLINKRFQKTLQKYLKDQKIIDFIIFGSSVKGKIKPNDLDIAILVREKIDQKEILSIRKELQEHYKKTHIEQISIEEYNSRLFLVLLREGYSVRHKKYLHDLYGVEPTSLFTYSLKTLNPSQKVMFHRGIKSISKIKRLSNTVVMVSAEQTANFQDFLKQWNIDIESKEYSLLPQLRGEF
jgi:predicted nucleotidyltransferase